jgi:uncharacterized protein (TIGR00251 family)
MARRRPDNQRPPRGPASSEGDAVPPELPWLQVRGADLLLRVRVQPRASHEGVEGVQGDRLRMRVSAPPVEGAANTRVVLVLAELLGIPRAQLRVTRGAKSREKDLLIQGAAARAAELAARLQAPAG